jgi:hypothetical protein
MHRTFPFYSENQDAGGGSAQQQPDQASGDPPPEQQDAAANNDASQNVDEAKDKAGKTQPKLYTQREFTTEMKRQLVAAEEDIRARIKADLDLEEAKNKGELSKVIERHETRIKALEPMETEVLAFRALAEQRYQTIFDTLPDSIKLFAPADDAPILEKERWLVEKALPAAEKLTGPDPVKGLSRRDDPQQKGKGKDEIVQEIRNGYSLTGEYRPM